MATPVAPLAGSIRRCVDHDDPASWQVGPSEIACDRCLADVLREVRFAADGFAPVIPEPLHAQSAKTESATEWGAKWSDGGYAPACPPRNEEWVRWHARVMGTKPIRRHVGPWVYADTGEVVWP